MMKMFKKGIPNASGKTTKAQGAAHHGTQAPPGQVSKDTGHRRQPTHKKVIRMKVNLRYAVMHIKGPSSYASQLRKANANAIHCETWHPESNIFTTVSS